MCRAVGGPAHSPLHHRSAESTHTRPAPTPCIFTRQTLIKNTLCPLFWPSHTHLPADIFFPGGCAAPHVGTKCRTGVVVRVVWSVVHSSRCRMRISATHGHVGGTLRYIGRFCMVAAHPRAAARGAFATRHTPRPNLVNPLPRVLRWLSRNGCPARPHGWRARTLRHRHAQIC